MKTKFKDFLNEYGGPGRTIGFRYSAPSIEYGVLVPIIINDNVDVDGLKSDIKEILDRNNVEEDFFNLEQVEDEQQGYTPYELEIQMKGYSKYELQSMVSVVLDNVAELYEDDLRNEDMYILGDRIAVKGADLDPKSKPLGYTGDRIDTTKTHGKKIGFTG
jgi:hypothetical protein